ncbi:MAG: HAAS signaling domain-containing protein, partial [Candidatus Thorarchaeota archaeon]
MTEDSYVEIDDYLKLVRSHLPNEIADEIILEIRTYLVEMAQELGHGQISAESARRSIARFGVPSEIAQEYSRSVLNAEDYALDHDPAYEESDRESVENIIGRFPKKILTAFGLLLTWFVLFAFMVVLVAYSLAPPHEFYF